MQNMEYFLADRALTLSYEARKNQQTAPVARAWLERAADWALRNGFQNLADKLCKQAREMQEDNSHVLRNELSL